MMVPSTQLTVNAPEIRTLQEMRLDADKKVPPIPTDGDADRPRVKPFLPTIDAGEYLRHKQTPHIPPAFSFLGKRHGLVTREGATIEAPAGKAAVVVGPNFDGASDHGEGSPPDTHGAVGAQHFVEVTNSHVDIYEKGNVANHTSISHAAFFGYTTQALFDARAVYDLTFNRWVIMAEAFPESATTQFHFIAVSTTASPLDPFFIYQLNVAFNSGDFWDFPQLGIDQNAVIITANVFPASGNATADMFAVPKAALYNGQGFSVPLFTGLVSTLAPPIVLDANSSTFLIAAPPNSSALQLYTLQNSGGTGVTLTGPVAIPVDPYTIPPSAPQPNQSDPKNNLDTGDDRFVNASTQVGDSLWQVHTIALGGFSAPRFYQINTATGSVIQSGFFFATLTSFDFNASIAANTTNQVFVTWSATDPPNGTNAQVRFSGSDNSAGTVSFGAGDTLFTSGAQLTGDLDPRFGLQRWGDYSAVTIDPANQAEAWVVNEKVDSATTWGSRIGAIGL